MKPIVIAAVVASLAFSTNVSAQAYSTLDEVFKNFDGDKNGKLEPLEFALFVMAMHDPARGGQLAKEAQRARRSVKDDHNVVELLNKTSPLLAQLDKNHDERIERDELAPLLQEGATARR